MSKKVAFVVGATLDGPMSVEHVIDGENSSSKKQRTSASRLPRDPQTSKTKDTGKRTCGHSQKDARLRKKNS